MIADPIIKARHLLADTRLSLRNMLETEAEMSRWQIPVMYVGLLMAMWAVAAPRIAMMHPWLTVVAPLLMTLLGIICARHALRSYDDITSLTAEKPIFAVDFGFQGIGFTIISTGWFLALAYSVDAADRVHLAFDMATTIIFCILCLKRLPFTVIVMAMLANTMLIGIFTMMPHPPIAHIAAFTFAGTAILGVNFLDFTRTTNALAQARLKEKGKRRLLRMIDDMPVAVMTVDPNSFDIDYVNETSKDLIRSIEHLLPLKADDLLGSSVDVFHRYPEHQRDILADPANLPHNARIKLGTEVLDLKVSAITADNGKYLGPMLTWAIVTKEVEAERRIRQLAHFDTLTGLANRVTFKEELEASIAIRGDGPALLFIDLDGFKMVNDTEGHRVGDELLANVADRLREICDRPGVTIGRLGGDEFAVIVPIDKISKIESFANSIIETLSATYEIGSHRELHIGASIGIAFAPEHGDTADGLLARADIALYVAKAAGKGTHRTFSEDMEERIQERMRLHSALRSSLESQEGLFLFYQPIVDVQTRKVTAREALMRWYHPTRGWVPPCEFVPVAEQSSLIDQLGAFQLNTACQEAVTWDDDARVAVNVSAAQFGKGTIAQTVLEALARSGLPPNRLEIEITETAMLGDEGGVTSELRRIRGLGVRVALDDFGTGYSSLTHLRAFPFDKIKIDGSFVQDAVDRPEAAAVVRAIADLGKRLGVTTVAEGVKTLSHLNRVIEEGCTEVQGYYFSHPVPSKSDTETVDRLNASDQGVVTLWKRAMAG